MEGSLSTIAFFPSLHTSFFVRNPVSSHGKEREENAPRRIDGVHARITLHSSSKVLRSVGHPFGGGFPVCMLQSWHQALLLRGFSTST